MFYMHYVFYIMIETKDLLILVMYLKIKELFLCLRLTGRILYLFTSSKPNDMTLVVFYSEI